MPAVWHEICSILRADSNQQCCPDCLNSVAVATDGQNYLLAYTQNGIFGPAVKTAAIDGRQGDLLGLYRDLTRTLDTHPSWVGEVDVASNRAGYFVVWTQFDTRPRARTGIQPGYNIFGARVNRLTGHPEDAVDRPVISSATTQRRPTVGSGGRDYLVAWEDGNLGQRNILGKLLLDGDPTRTISIGMVTAAGDQHAPQAAFANGRFLLLYNHETGADSDLYAKRYSFFGGLQDGAPSGLGNAVNAQRGDQADATVAAAGRNFLVTWSDSRNGRSDTYMTLVSSTNGQPMVGYGGTTGRLVQSNTRNVGVGTHGRCEGRIFMANRHETVTSSFVNYCYRDLVVWPPFGGWWF